MVPRLLFRLDVFKYYQDTYICVITRTERPFVKIIVNDRDTR